MDEDFGAQLDHEKQSDLVKLYRQLNLSYRSGTRFNGAIIKPILAWRRRRLANRVNGLVKECIQRKFDEEREKFTEKGAKKSRSVLALSLQGIDELTPQILDQTCDQLKTFLFAGHDTTSILLQWAFYELSRTPRALKAIRQELDEIFGPDPSPSVVRDSLLSSHGDQIQRMSYVSAVIKETLRLYPPAGTARYQTPGTGYNVQLPGGKSLCLDGVVMYNCATIIQRDETVYGPSANEFMPERWLGDTDTSMQTNTDEKSGGGANGNKIPASAWRPFERGPRNCIGQELANLEARVILACTVRRYDFTKVGLGEVALDEEGKPIENEHGQYKVKSENYNVRPSFIPWEHDESS